MLTAVEGEGMPLMRDPFQFGNLFLQLEIEFPQHLNSDTQNILKQVLPAGMNFSDADESSEDVDTNFISMLDPVVSYRNGDCINKEPFDEDETGQRTECTQQ